MSGTVCGLILAGGRASRFGREKALATLQGRPLIDHVAEVLARGTAALAVSASPHSGAAAYAAGRGWPALQDRPGDPPGPMAGLLAGLRWAWDCGARWLCSAPCDTPFLPQELISTLVAKAGDHGALAWTMEGPQPLCALWPTTMLEMRQAWPQTTAPRELLAQIGATRVDFPDAAAFANLNTPEDYAAAQTAAARRVR